MKFCYFIGSDIFCFNVEFLNVWFCDLYVILCRRWIIMVISVYVYWGYLWMDMFIVLCESILWFLKWVKEL